MLCVRYRKVVQLFGAIVNTVHDASARCSPEKTRATETSQVNSANHSSDLSEGHRWSSVEKLIGHAEAYVKSMTHPQSFFPGLAPPLRLVCDMDGRSWWLRWGSLSALAISVRVGAFDTFSLFLGEHVPHVLYVCVTHGDESRISADHKL